ncbi:alpha/beta fold hydrolase [Kitasatospora sp. NPDC048296]|uniref:alpha/beta fold hydrolase n=1 Tax=Kitasatospora sp. NPDC048296 TaxID=3364048 RepID=UPI00371BB524
MTIAALDLPAVHVVGCSYGGWIALHHQIRHPGRTAGLTLVDTAGLADVGRRFYTWLILGGLAATAPRALRPRLARAIGNSAILETELMTLMRASIGFRRRLPLATTLTDEELGRLNTPALFLLGERSAMNDARAASERLHRLVPAARVEIVPDAGHSLPTDDVNRLPAGEPTANQHFEPVERGGGEVPVAAVLLHPGRKRLTPSGEPPGQPRVVDPLRGVDRIHPASLRGESLDVAQQSCAQGWLTFDRTSVPGDADATLRLPYDRRNQ